jgi:hypothetical protein
MFKGLKQTVVNGSVATKPPLVEQEAGTDFWRTRPGLRIYSSSSPQHHNRYFVQSHYYYHVKQFQSVLVPFRL